MSFIMDLKKITTLLGGLLVLHLFSSCASQYGKVSFEESPSIINVSHYDPKESQRRGSSYTPLNQYSLKKNGALGQIARCSKGYAYDKKCADFLVGAERQGLLLGTVPHMVAFVSEIKKLTGEYPMVYLENGELIRKRLRDATYEQKYILRKCPYWLALYSPNYPGISTPRELTLATGVWKTWSLWQYGGVEWERGRSVPKHYVKGPWKTPKYYGDLSKPLERNGFNGSRSELYSFWAKHSWRW